MKPFTHALALGFSRRVPTEGSCKRLFCFLRDPDAMRNVGGGKIRNPVTRASQSRDGGRIPRAGWLKKSGIVRMRRHGSVENVEAQSELYSLTVRLCFAQTITIENI